MSLSAIASVRATGVSTAVSAASAASSVTNRVMAIALEILDEIRAMGIRTLESIVPCTQYDTNGDPVEHYARLGERYFMIADQEYGFQLARSGIDILLEKEGVTESTPQPTKTVTIEMASAMEMKVSGCGELGYIAFVLAGKKGLRACWIPLMSKDKQDSHAIVIVGEDASCGALGRRISHVQKMKVPLLDQLANLTGTVIVDPYLGMAIRAEDVKKTEKFVASLAAMRVDTVEQVFTFDIAKGDYANIWEMALANRAALRVITERITAEESKNPSELPSTFCFIMEKRQERMITLLGEKFPATRGKWKEAKGLLYVNLEDEAVYTSVRAALAGVEKLQTGSFTDKAGKRLYSIRIPVSTYDKVRRAFEKVKGLGS